MKPTFFLLSCMLALLLATPIYGHGLPAGDGADFSTSRPDGHAPIGVMGDHTHGKDEWMLGYRYMSMHMEGLRDGTEALTPADIFAQGYMVAPLEMTMEMHATGVMYAPSDELTLVLMIPYIRKKMTMQTMMNQRLTTRTEGIGDLRLSGLYMLRRTDLHQLHLNLGVSLPTGSTDEHGRTPMMANAKLPYGMQLGSGTVDLHPGLTWLGQRESWSYGVQLGTTLRLGRNDEGYTLGDRAATTVWAARRLSSWASVSARLAGTAWESIDGADPALNPSMSPAVDTDNHGGFRVDALGGLNLYAPTGAFAGHRLAIEAGAPIYQDLSGPQLETDWLLTIGWQYAF